MYQSNQEVFDVVAKHLLIQNAKSMIKNMYLTDLMCAYRGKNGAKCAVGILIPDELYAPDMEGTTIDGPVIRMALKKVVSSEVHYNLIEALQNVHDKSCPDDWKMNLENVAVTYNLDPMVVTSHV
jgi:hypothetical protein